MNVTNDAPAMDYVQYFTKQLPQDLAKMAALRDELAKRQGALNAAETAVAGRERLADDRETKAAEAARALASDRAALDARIKAFQDRVASF